MNARRKMQEILSQRTAMLAAAESAMTANNMEEYKSCMEKVGNMNAEIEQLQSLIAEQDKQYAVPGAQHVSKSEVKDRAEERMNALTHGEAITFSAEEVRSMVLGNMTDSVVVGGGDAEPVGAGNNVHGGDAPVSSIVDMVTLVDATGLGAFIEPYVKAEIAAQGGKVTTVAGTARTDTDPDFGTVKINPYEVTTTTYLDRNLRRLSPVAYEAKVQQLVSRALRRKLAALIFAGDGQATPDFFGIYTAKDTAGAAMISTIGAAAISDTLLGDIAFNYGGDEDLGAFARLFLSKADLKALGALRDADGRRLLDIVMGENGGNMGTLKDGGLFVPYGLSSAVGTIGTAAKNAKTMIYGDPKNFELALFGDMTIRIDQSYKAGERLDTILGDCVAGGNVIVKDGFTVVTKAEA